MEMRTIDPKDLEIKDLHQYIVGAIAPRPIAFASTIDENGVANIAPYSFFNAFSSNPPVFVFSSNRSVRTGETKDTLHNVEANKEVVINVVDYNLVRQMTLASIAYPASIDEFVKAGLTPVSSDTVKPYRIAESPVQFECKVKEVVTLGEHGGAGHLIICEVQRFHVRESVIDGNRIDPHKLDLVGRLGRAYYVRASGDALFTIYQNPNELALGFDKLPDSIKQSMILTGGELATIAGQLSFPTENDIEQILESDVNLGILVDALATEKEALKNALHRYAKKMIEAKDYKDAFTVLMLADQKLQKD
jgi:flavin reductase (DIM6/NTAB) family NADH-FMN oxidoreductase RutF